MPCFTFPTGSCPTGDCVAVANECRSAVDASCRPCFSLARALPVHRPSTDRLPFLPLLCVARDNLPLQKTACSIYVDQSDCETADNCKYHDDISLCWPADLMIPCEYVVRQRHTRGAAARQNAVTIQSSRFRIFLDS